MALDKIKVLILGIAIYISGNLFFTIGRSWFPELNDINKFKARVDVIRKNFWTAISLSTVVIFGTVIILISLEKTNWNSNLIMRMLAIIFALSASLGRGGWHIQTIDGWSIIERIDRDMFKISQLGASALLIMALLMK